MSLGAKKPRDAFLMGIDYVIGVSKAVRLYRYWLA